MTYNTNMAALVYHFACGSRHEYGKCPIDLAVEIHQAREDRLQREKADIDAKEEQLKADALKKAEVILKNKTMSIDSTSDTKSEKKQLSDMKPVKEPGLIRGLISRFFKSQLDQNEISEPTTLKTQVNVWTDSIKGKGLTRGGAWDTLRTSVLKRDGHTCTSCGIRYNLTVDHKVPLSMGGDNALSNLITLCRDCHENKDHIAIFSRDFDADDNYGQNPKISKKITLINNCIRSNGRISIRYKDAVGNITNRSISPKRLVRDKGRIYLVADCHLRGSERMFRVARMEI